jgi:hypothetical protein
LVVPVPGVILGVEKIDEDKTAISKSVQSEMNMLQDRRPKPDET